MHSTADPGQLPTPPSSATQTKRVRAPCGPDHPEAPRFPFRMHGAVVKGFGRGSKDLGIPTGKTLVLSDQLQLDVVDRLDASDPTLLMGIYYGWARVVPRADRQLSSGDDDGDADRVDSRVFPMVMSIGWNPFYKNQHRSAEVHIMHEYGRDFYGEDMRVLVTGYLRPELDYTTVDALIEDIRLDIEIARLSLERPAFAVLKDDAFLVEDELVE